MQTHTDSRLHSRGNVPALQPTKESALSQLVVMSVRCLVSATWQKDNVCSNSFASAEPWAMSSACSAQCRLHRSSEEGADHHVIHFWDLLSFSKQWCNSGMVTL
ncbi:hypothetical protein M758_6G126900 [Ceratodon purpureus]|uniref:Uncharacterized protein n=1 Tax=Ceratodon purpureus TaxID=3225 RepID=A0A8T0HHA5_CERPU|nr:hypothetical protein KC19_6G132100 [Ceratodon purpureus]KAG0613743.1 hypothetical protein M758_6G126900 [Ceratodon purpureus]